MNIIKYCFKDHYILLRCIYTLLYIIVNTRLIKDLALIKTKFILFICCLSLPKEKKMHFMYNYEANFFILFIIIIIVIYSFIYFI